MGADTEQIGPLVDHRPKSTTGSYIDRKPDILPDPAGNRAQRRAAKRSRKV